MNDSRPISDPAQNLTDPKFSGFSVPNTFPCPNELIDNVMSSGQCTPAEICILLVVNRQTFGFHKMWDRLSDSQLMQKASLSKQGVTNCLRNLQEKNLIQVAYTCRKCKAIRPDGKSECPACASREKPFRWLAIKIQGISITEYLRDILQVWIPGSQGNDATEEERQSYAEYLQSPKWKEKRKRKIKEAGFRCQLCNNKESALHVHHRTYENVGNEKLSDLIV